MRRRLPLGLPRSKVQLTLAIALCLFQAGTAHAVETKKEFDQVQQQLKSERARIQKLVAREGSLLDEIEKADQRIENERKALKAISVRLEEIQKERDGLAKEIDLLEVKVGDTKRILKKRLRTVYRQFREGNLAVLVSTEGYQELVQRAKYLTYFADHDRRLIEDYREGQELLTRRRQDLKNLELSLEDTARKRRAQKENYNQEREKKKILLTSIRGEKSHYQKMVTELEEAAVALRELMRREEEERKRREAEEAAARASQSRKPFAKMKGGLRWPVNGHILSRYGSQRDPEFNTPIFRNGIEIAANDGERVQAVLDGRVVYADRFKGYGNLVILDHGDGYHTLYAHLSESAVIPGEEVDRGQIMGIVGESGTGGAINLYFEIRHRGKPIDPGPWLARRR